MTKKQSIRFFDTTLRDGEQSPGFSMSIDEKIQVARQLDRLGVDTIEAGFPITSNDDFEAVSKISAVVKNAEVCGLCRAVEKDILRAYEAIKNAKKPVIHTFISTSPVHRDFKLGKSKEEVLNMAVKAVKLAKSLCDRVIFSPEDATRTEKDYLYQVLEEVIKAGADTLNIADTVGYSTPEEFKEFIEDIVKNVKGIENVVISTHCQNDLGLATANSLAGVLGGAREIQATINGIGERAGNASLEECVMAIETRKDFYGFESKINTKEIYPSSRLVTTITGISVQPNKAIVGANAFAHESGIHQDGMLKNRDTYEIMKPEDVGIEKTKIVLGKHSGRHALKTRLKALGIELEDERLNEVFVDFKELADKKKQIYDEDLYLLVNNNSTGETVYELKDIVISCGTVSKPSAVVILSHNTEGEKHAVGSGDGPVDSAYQAINKIINIPNKLLEYGVNAVTEGIDAQATVSVKIEVNERLFSGSSSNTDITVASVIAYIDALNKAILYGRN